MAPRLIENTILRLRESAVDGALRLDPTVYPTFLAAPWDLMPDFQGPLTRKLTRGRGMDHPRYGRFIYAFARVYKPAIVVEVGSYAGGTAIGWATALVQNGTGRLICVDHDLYAKGTFPDITRGNILKTHLRDDRFELRGGDSRELVPALATEFRGQVDAYLVDGDHSYEGALADMENGLPMLKPGGFMLVHDVDRDHRMLEQTAEHPHPVYEALMKVVNENRLEWTILRYIRRHLAVVRVP